MIIAGIVVVIGIAIYFLKFKKKKSTKKKKSSKDNKNNFEPINERKKKHSPIELEAIVLTNEYRVSKGLPRAKRLIVISQIAQSHTKYMIKKGKVSHDNFPQRNTNLMRNANAKSVGENVSFGYGTAKGAVNGWIRSEEHRKILETKNFTHFGVSIEKDSKGRNYFTLMFIKK